MEIIKKIAEIRKAVKEARNRKQKVGLVPTMGYLHEGHLSLVKAAAEESDLVIVSIFVNPTQFGPGEDFETYPRDLQADTQKLREYKVDYIFAPLVAEMYPDNYNSFVEVFDITSNLCGKSRPHFFRGVTTVVTKLFNIVQPDYAYFGQKDFQQLVVIKKMVRDLNMPIKVRGLPIIRENDGLAMSSRNKYLTKEEREAAVVLFNALNQAEDMITSGERDLVKVKKMMIDIIKKEPLAKIDYAAAVHPESLQDIGELKDQVLLALAVFIGQTRLIDNRWIQL